MDREDWDRIYQIEDRLNATTKGNWKHIYNYDHYIETEDEEYIAQTTYDDLSTSKNHNVVEDSEFIANSKQDIEFLLRLVRKLNGNVIDPKTHKAIQDMIDNMG